MPCPASQIWVTVKKSSPKNLSADCRSTVGRLWAVCRPSVGHLLAICRQAELGRYLSSLHWSLLFTSLKSCDDLERAFREAILTGLDIIMPLKRVRLNTKDAPWMTPELKSMIIKRQRAFHDLGPNSIQYKFYRNTVNRKRKLCKSKFHESKIQHLKDKDPKRWWNEVAHSYVQATYVTALTYLNLTIYPRKTLQTHSTAQS